MHNNQEDILLFIEESLEHLEGIEEDLLNIEGRGEDLDSEIVNKAFRAVHTIKGSSGFLSLNTIEALAHAMESILNKIRNRELEPTSEIIGVLLEAADFLTDLVKKPLESENADITHLLSSIGGLSPSVASELSHLKRSQDSEFDKTGDIEDDFEILNKSFDIKFDNEDIFVIDGLEIVPIFDQDQYLYLLKFKISGDNEKLIDEKITELEDTGTIINRKKITEKKDKTKDYTKTQPSSHFVLYSSMLDPDIAESIFDFEDLDIFNLTRGNLEKIYLNKISVDTLSSSGNQAIQPKPCLSVEENSQVKTDTSKENISDQSTDESSTQTMGSLRVNLKYLNQLMYLAGELVLVRNQINQIIANDSSHHLYSSAHRLDFITSQLQESILSTHAQPIGIVFKKFQRFCRDLSQKLDKKVNVILKGEDVELDKTIIDTIGDPLTHIVRNSIDHGIELPEEREKSGKNPVGTVEISAYHKGGQVYINISDDGRGIDLDQIKEKVLENGLTDTETLANMTDYEVLNMIMLPGFTTAKEVTDTSGRGVGLDVAKTNVNKLGGTINIESEYGMGTNILIKMPLTLAIISSMLVKVEHDIYAIPQINIIELLRMPQAKINHVVERLGTSPVIRLREHLIPIFRLTDFLGIKDRSFKHPKSGEMLPDRRSDISDRRNYSFTPSDIGSDTEKRYGKDRRENPLDALKIVIVNTGDQNVGIIVNSFLDIEEIVVQPLGRHLRGVEGYSGATILGDGSVALILDVIGIVNSIQLLKGGNIQPDEPVKKEAKEGDESQSLLLVQNSSDEYFGIPLELVIRIEKIESSSIQVTSGVTSIQIRDKSIPVMMLEDIDSHNDAKRSEDSIVAHITFGRTVIGLTASKARGKNKKTLLTDNKTLKRPGILGSTINNGSISQILDLNYLLKKELPKIFGSLGAKLRKQALPKEFQKDELSFFIGKNGMNYSIPSTFIKRTSKIKNKNIQLIDGKYYTSVSGKTIPLLLSEDIEKLYQHKLNRKLHAIIFPLADRDVGLIVTNIVNTCEAAVKIDEVTYKRPGVFGSVLVEGNITQVLDLYGIAEFAFKNIVEFQNESKTKSGITPTVLVVDDSDFFLNIIKNYVQYAGYTVYTAKDGVEGLEILSKYSKEIELVITDIDMPNMDGIEFTKKIRSTTIHQHLPIVAVSSLSDEKSVKRGIDAGVDVYLAKLDREKILKSISKLLRAKI